MILSCDQDCWKCTLEGCPYILLESDKLDREIEKGTKDYRQEQKYLTRKKWQEKNKEKIAEYQRAYNRSDRGKALRKSHRQTDKYKQRVELYKQTENYKIAVDKYNKSEKRKMSAKKYNQSEKGKEKRRQYQQTEAFKEKSRQNARAYYELHKEEILERRRLKRLTAT